MHMCGFNYRFVPAVRLAREIVESGDLGELFHFRARYLQSWGASSSRSPTFMGFWWPPGHIVGWGDTFTHEVHRLLAAIAGKGTVAPHGATFEDGYRCAEICDAIVRSSESGKREEISYR